MLKKWIFSILFLLVANGYALESGLPQPYSAPALVGTSNWMNSPPLTLSALKGKVVLIDFWTYSCINCIRTLPFLNKLYAKYHQKGLVIIGVHSPEFDFEKIPSNVSEAIKRFNIQYPVVMDNDFATWQAYQNQFWPAHYLINPAGQVVYQHFGEGGEAAMENNIRELLGLTPSSSEEKTLAAAAITPETYLGYARSDRFANLDIPSKDAAATYHFPHYIDTNQWALQGEWIIYPDRIVAVKAGAAIRLNFTASKVFAVMRTEGQDAKVKVIFDGKSAKDLSIKSSQLYTLIDSTKTNSGILELIAVDPGVSIYTFTFG